YAPSQPHNCYELHNGFHTPLTLVQFLGRLEAPRGATGWSTPAPALPGLLPTLTRLVHQEGDTPHRPMTPDPREGSLACACVGAAPLRHTASRSTTEGTEQLRGHLTEKALARRAHLPGRIELGGK